MTTYQTNPLNKTNWTPIQRPAEVVESRLVDGILQGTFPVNSHLPGERELAERLGVTRPTLREAMQRLAVDGWLEIHHGKPTRVRDYLKEGKLGVLNTLSEHPEHLPNNFIPDLLNVRLAMAPTYTALAIANQAPAVSELLKGRHALHDSPQKFSEFDWHLQHEITLLSDNPVFVMLLNSFRELYLNLAPKYFSIPAARTHSMQYYNALAITASEKDSQQARTLTEEIMQESLTFWRQTDYL